MRIMRNLSAHIIWGGRGRVVDDSELEMGGLEPGALI